MPTLEYAQKKILRYLQSISAQPGHVRLPFLAEVEPGAYELPKECPTIIELFIVCEVLKNLFYEMLSVVRGCT